jgi:lysophospholipase L1-like esterase
MPAEPNAPTPEHVAFAHVATAATLGPSPVVSTTRAPVPAPTAGERQLTLPAAAASLSALKLEAQERILGVGNAFPDSLPGTPAPATANQDALLVRHYDRVLAQPTRVEPGSALSKFHQRLAAFEQRPEPQQKLRIAVYGASHTEGDYYTSYLRYYMQSRFGNGGPGFVALGKVNDWYRLLSIRVDAQGLRVHYAQNNKPEVPGYYGLLGAASSASSGAAFGRVSPRDPRDPRSFVSQFEFSYLATPTSGDLQLVVDGEPAIPMSGRADSVQNRIFTFRRPLGPHRFEVHPQGNGPVRWFGVTLERDEAGIVVDTLGISGTRAANLLTWDEPLWREHLARRDPALVVLAYGTNEALDHAEPIVLYRERLREVIARIQRAAPNSSCVLVGPGEFERRNRQGLRLAPTRLREVIEIQRGLATEMGCGFWDLERFMGGTGAMARWVNNNPPLAADDHIHFTPRGYVRMGIGLTDALLEGYDAAHVPAVPMETAERSVPPALDVAIP